MKSLSGLRIGYRIKISTGLVCAVFLSLTGCGGDSNNTSAAMASATTVVRTANLTGAQEVPPVTNTTATARGAVVVDATTRQITGGLTYDTAAITPTAAHIHVGASGTNGNIIIGLTMGDGTLTIPHNTILSPSDYDSLLAGNLYFNIHTAANMAGEIRGQINIQGGVTVGLATLTGAQEVPPVTTSASGTGTIVVDSSTQAIITAVATTSGIPMASAAHIHMGGAGTAPPNNIILGLDLITNDNTSSATAVAMPGVILTDAQYASLLAGNLYFNVHTATNTAGEIRGQIGVQQELFAGSPTTLAAIQNSVFTPTCAISGCHSGPSARAGLRLDAGFSSSNLVNVQSSQNRDFVRVIPGNPNDSLLIQKLEGTQTVGARMPLGGTPLSQATINNIRNWIASGAQP